MAVEFNPASSYGITTGTPDFRAIYEKLSAAELERLKPNQNLQEKYKLSHTTWNDARTHLENVQLAADVIVDRETFLTRQAISSDPEIVTATATSLAEPGVYQLVVDKTAFHHQIGSQKYASKDAYIGDGQIFIGFSDERPQIFEINQSNNTLQGLVDTINNANLDIQAAIVKLDDEDTPYQFTLTSKRSGEEGRIIVQTQLSGGEEPLFEYRYEQPTRWYYAPGKVSEEFNGVAGASSTIPNITGEYTGNRDIEFTFSVVSPGQVGGDESPSIRWEDDTGRSGILKLGQYDYHPNLPLPLVDGLMISFSDGILVLDDTFKIEVDEAKGPILGIFGSGSPSEINSPSNWSMQKSNGSAMIDGVYTGDGDDFYRITVREGGVVGTSPSVLIDYESEKGQSGTLDFGLDYTPGNKQSIGNGLALSIPSGVLQTGFETEFAVQPSVPSSRWWLFADGIDSDQEAIFTMPVDWNGQNDSSIDPNVYDPRSKKSNAVKIVTGNYRYDDDKKYKFTARGEGRVGVSAGLYVDWEDNFGNNGTLEVGSNYNEGSPIEFDSGLSISFDNGYIFEGDYFFVEAFSPTIVPPQDAQIRLGVTESGQAGQLYTSSTNEIDDAITGVTLNLHKADPKVVTITIEEDQEKVKEAIKEFILNYNEALKFIHEAVKYDPETKIAGPLQAERTLVLIQEELRKILVDVVPGLPTDANTLPYAGIQINSDGFIEFDEQLLDQRLVENFNKVVNIFRNYAETNNAAIRYVGSNETTVASGEAGYNIDITNAPKAGLFRSVAFNGPFNIPAGDNRYAVTIDGKKSDPIAIDDGDWSIRQIAREISKNLSRDPNLNGTDYDIDVVNNQLVISSNNYGNNSSVLLESVSGVQLPFIAGGQTIAGENVAGTINGHQAIGSGRLLVGSDGFPEAGIEFFVTLTDDNQINSGEVEANAIFTVGKGAVTKLYLDQQLKKNSGPVDTSIKTYSDRIESLGNRLEIQTDRIERKKDRLARQFINAEKRINELQSQQAELYSQGLITR